MPIIALSVEEKSNQHILLVKQFCEAILIHNDLTLLSGLCKEDIIFYSNITSKSIQGIRSLHALHLRDSVTQPFSILNYDIIETSIDSEGTGYIVLNIFSNIGIFHISSSIIHKNNELKDDTYLLSRVHLFYEKQAHECEDRHNQNNKENCCEDAHNQNDSENCIVTSHKTANDNLRQESCPTHCGLYNVAIDTQYIQSGSSDNSINKIKIQDETEECICTAISELYNNTPSAIIHYAANKLGSIGFANTGLYTLIGYSSDEFDLLYQNNIMNIIHVNDVANVKKLLLTNSNNEKTFSFTCRILPKNADPKWLNITASFIKNINGTEFIHLTCQDITGNYEILHDLMLMKEKMEVAIRDIGLHHWEYFPNQNRIHFIDNIFQNNAIRSYNNIPESVIKLGLINPISVAEFRNIHARVKAGEPYVEGVILCSFTLEEKEAWHKIRYTTIFDSEGTPSLAVGTGENISAYKEIEHRFSIITNQTGIDIWKYNIDNKTITQEANIAKIGVNQIYFDNVPEKGIEAGVVYKEDHEKYREMYRQLDRGIQHVSCDLRMKSVTSNKFIWTRLFYTILPDKDGRGRIALGSAIDISDQKAAAEHYENEIHLWNMRTNNSLLSCVINISANSVVSGNGGLGINTTDGSAEYFLESICTLIAKEKEKEAYSQVFTIKKMIQQFECGIRSRSLEFNIFIKKESAWISFSVSMVKNVLQNDIIAFVSINDITEKKISQDFTQEFLTSQFDYVFRINYAEDTYSFYAAPHIKNKLPNIPSAGKYSQYIINFLKNLSVKDKSETLIEEFSIKRLLERSAQEEKYSFIAQSKDTSKPKGTPKPKGSAKKIRYKKLRVFQRDDITKTICIACVDITDLHEQGQKHIQTLRDALLIAKKANKSKSKFLASMSHDLRTPMNAIIGMTNLALEDQNNPTQIAESLDIIKSSSEHLLTLLNDILEMSRLESGRILFNQELFSITRECTKIYNFYRGIANHKKQKLDLKCINIVHDEVFSNKKDFGRILINLLGNAIKFTPNEGKISMTIEEIEIQNEKNNIFRVIIKDSGIGIAKENFSSIFEPFNRTKNFDVNEAEGTGLGLAIVKNLVDGLSGIISVNSQIGLGSTFTIELAMCINGKPTKQETTSSNVLNEHNANVQASIPEITSHKYAIKNTELKDTDVKDTHIKNTYMKNKGANVKDANVKDAQSKTWTTKDINLSAMHILLIDDHLINILVASKMLQKMGAQITTAKNGKEGYEAFCNSQQGTYNLIFMDLQMPVMDGHESAFAIRSSHHPQASTIPIIAMTANAFAEDVISCKQSGMNYHIAKPISIENISKCLTELKLI